jgi:hypothetical protein
MGTVDTFGTYFAPADFNETANTLGQSIYAKQEPRKFDREPTCTRSPTRCRCAIAPASWSSSRRPDPWAWSKPSTRRQPALVCSMPAFGDRQTDPRCSPTRWGSPVRTNPCWMV